MRCVLPLLTLLSLAFAPAPLPRPCRVADNAGAVETLERELRKWGIVVKEVSQEGRGVWVVRFDEYNCMRWPHCVRFSATGRAGALIALLRQKEAEAQEREINMLRRVP